MNLDPAGPSALSYAAPLSNNSWAFPSPHSVIYPEPPYTGGEKVLIILFTEKICTL
jgi:hypothetical protein